jgi:photosystem II stability/assembly factor-like uncharacterized protein
MAMAVSGANLWFSVTTSAASQAHQLLVASTDAGQHFTTSASPCYPGLGGSIVASSPRVLWAVCPTGMEAQAFRSADAGASWKTLPVGELENSAQIAPASDTVAVIEPSQLGALLRTTDGGATWATVYPSSNGAHAWAWLGFTDASTGSGLQYASGSTSSAQPNEQLLRSTDGGAAWSGPVSF